MIHQTFENNIIHTVKDEISRQLMSKGCFTIPDIVERVGVSPTTVSKYVFEMQQKGILDILDHVKTDKRGRRPILYGLKSDSNYHIGVDIKNYSLSIGLMDVAGNIVRTYLDDEFRFENTYPKFEEICSAVEGFITDAKIENGVTSISSICFSLGGRVNTFLGTSASIFNFEEFHTSPLTDVLETRFGCKVFVENDTKAMTYGEYQKIAGKGIRNMLYVNIGWGLGLGVIVDGQLLHGHRGYAGELGHVSYYDNNILCHCGKKGCIETEVSGSAIHRKLIQRIHNGEQSILSGKVARGEEITLQDILFAAEKEDPLCVDIITWTGSELGKHLAGLINIFSPDCIMLGGIVSMATSYYFQLPLTAAIRKYSLKLISNKLTVATSALGEQAGIYGACLVARNRVFVNQLNI